MGKILHYIEKIIHSRDLPEDFLDSGSLFHDSALLPSWREIIQRIQFGIDNNETILIWGDQDVDGITASSILFLALREHTNKLYVHIPDRKNEGIGFNIKKLDELLKKIKPSLVITVDCCSQDKDGANLLKSRNVDLIITDHHETRDEKIHCIGLMNCKRKNTSYPFQNLAGCGIALKIALEFYQDDYLWLLASLGTIADRVPMLDENRYIVKKGLNILKKKKFKLIDILCELQNVEIPLTTRDIKKYIISPLSSDIVLKGQSVSFGFMTDNFKIEHVNEIIEKSRKWHSKKEKVISEASSAKEYINNNIFIYLPSIERDYLGTIASYFTHTEGLPAFVIGSSSNGKNILEARGSMNEVLPVLDKYSDLFLDHGGHKKAAGASILNIKIDDFKTGLKLYNSEIKDRKLRIDIQLSSCEIDDHVLLSFSCFGPFGQDFPEIAIEIIDGKPKKKINGKNIFLLDEAASLKEATVEDDIWK